MGARIPSLPKLAQLAEIEADLAEIGADLTSTEGVVNGSHPAQPRVIAACAASAFRQLLALPVCRFMIVIAGNQPAKWNGQ